MAKLAHQVKKRRVKSLSVCQVFLGRTRQNVLFSWLLLYSASWKQSDNYYNDGYVEKYPYDGAKVEEDKAKKPQYDKNHSNYEKEIKSSHVQKPYLPLTWHLYFKMCDCE